MFFLGNLGLMIERSALGGYACPRWPGSLGLVAPSCPAEHVWILAGHSGTSIRTPAKFPQEDQWEKWHAQKKGGHQAPFSFLFVFVVFFQIIFKDFRSFFNDGKRSSTFAVIKN